MYKTVLQAMKRMPVFVYDDGSLKMLPASVKICQHFSCILLSQLKVREKKLIYVLLISSARVTANISLRSKVQN